MDEEEWRVIPSFQRYEASTRGRIRNRRTKRLKDLGVWNSPYQTISLLTDSSPKMTLAAVHILIAETFLGPCPPRQEVAHRNHNRKDNRVNNLQYATHVDNVAQTVSARRHTHGSKHARAKLTETDVVEILGLRAKKMSQKRIARLYNVSQVTIRLIDIGETWKHVPRPVIEKDHDT